MKVLICGDRNYSNKEKIRNVIRNLMPDEVITGGASGADTLAEQCCKEDGFKVHVEKAKWELYHRAAGPIRNRKMLDMKPDLVVAFHSDLSKSKGTKDTVTEAKRRCIKVILYV